VVLRSITVWSQCISKEDNSRKRIRNCFRCVLLEQGCFWYLSKVNKNHELQGFHNSSCSDCAFWVVTLHSLVGKCHSLRNMLSLSLHSPPPPLTHARMHTRLRFRVFMCVPFPALNIKLVKNTIHWTIPDRIASTCDCYTYKYTNKINE
jgi:hypothetical protein